MIRATLISPTNLLLEHPLFLARKEETEFCVFGRKEYDRHRRDWFRYGVLAGLVSAVLLTGVISALVEVLR